MTQVANPQQAKLRLKLDELEQVVRSKLDEAAQSRRAHAPPPPVDPTRPAEADAAGLPGGRRGGATWLWRLFTGQR
jgi:hypothetical protein